MGSPVWFIDSDDEKSLFDSGIKSTPFKTRKRIVGIFTTTRFLEVGVIIVSYVIVIGLGNYNEKQFDKEEDNFIYWIEGAWGIVELGYDIRRWKEGIDALISAIIKRNI